MSPFKPLDPTALEAFETEPLEWVVDQLIPLGCLIILDGREKSGKGLFTIDLCVSVALGESFLDRIVFPGPAIYCFGEENVREVRQRTFSRLGPIRDAPIWVLPLNGQTDDRFSLQSPESLATLDQMIVDSGAKLIVLDTMREFHVLAEDSSDDMGPLLRPLRQIAHTRNVTIILNHHQNKSGTSRGSTAIRASADQSISLTRTDGDDSATIGLGATMPRGKVTVSGRFGPDLSIPVELGSDMRWVVSNAPPLSLDAPKRDIVLAYIRDFAHTRPITAMEIADGTLINLKTTQNLIASLLRDQPPPIQAFGQAKKGQPRHFALAGSFPDGWELGNDSGNDSGAIIVPKNDSRRVGIGSGNDYLGNDPSVSEPEAVLEGDRSVKHPTPIDLPADCMYRHLCSGPDHGRCPNAQNGLACETAKHVVHSEAVA